MNPNRRARAMQETRVREHAESSDAYTFFNLLTGPQWFDKVDSLLPAHRERLFPPTETLSMFLAQALSADRSCQAVVNDHALKRLSAGMSPGSTHTGAYCRARERLPMDMVSALGVYVGKAISAQVPAHWHWKGRPVRLVDGTTLVMPDTLANQAEFPQSRSQKPGLGFPICRLLGVMCLGSGALLEMAVGPTRGPGTDEQALLRSLLHTLAPGDVLVGDAYFATYFLLCTLVERGVTAVFEQHWRRARSTDFRCGKRLGARDHLIVLHKPAIKPAWMSPSQYEAAPASLSVRELRVSGKVLITTLLDPNQASKADLKALYKDRWHVELNLRHLKSTLGLECLTCKTPQMVRKEIWVYMLAYNLIRAMMAQAAHSTHCLPRAVSFKHTVQIWQAWTHHAHGIDQAHQVDLILVLITEQRVGERPGRIEPRAVKRRNKPYPLLTKPRELATQHVRKFGHPKKVK